MLDVFRGDTNTDTGEKKKWHNVSSLSFYLSSIFGLEVQHLPSWTSYLNWFHVPTCNQWKHNECITANYFTGARWFTNGNYGSQRWFISALAWDSESMLTLCLQRKYLSTIVSVGQIQLWILNLQNEKAADDLLMAIRHLLSSTACGHQNVDSMKCCSVILKSNYLELTRNRFLFV